MDHLSSIQISTANVDCPWWFTLVKTAVVFYSTNCTPQPV